MAETISNRWKYDVAKAAADSVLKVLLVGTTYSVDASHRFVADIAPASNEVSGTGYSRLTVTGAVATEDDINNRAVLDFDDPVWSALDVGSVGGAWLYQYVTSDLDSPLRQFTPFSPARTSNGGEFRLRVSASGALWVVAG